MLYSFLKPCFYAFERVKEVFCCLVIVNDIAIHRHATRRYYRWRRQRVDPRVL